MRFDIEGFITFDTEDASLVNLLTGDCVELSQTSTRLLAELLNHQGDILSRNEIFQTVFDKYGARASNSNLNQYISTLRRNLSDLGIAKEIIVTVPRIGFKIAEDAIINNDREYRTPFLEEKEPEAPPVEPQKLCLKRFTRIIALAIAFLLLIINPDSFRADTDIKKLVQGQCVIFMPSSLSLREVTKSFDFVPQPFDCSQQKELYVYKQQVQGALGDIVQLLLIKCDKDSCMSFYYREKNNA
ncbi:winged helix-turn-helix domain-containing protein [Citrobacter amalonaticus]|uniref:winged helix-turn-helix domain-containing protein n=1 Tax=Citrobacter amalonaticus TaxID=35703 RepID=UPI001A332ECD|nr:winged helix-turn-helix domain-containing protein [Citrobacter amalonaticus]MDT7077199.1 winged helix-turn-helix domain-containing protein [Citrobacter amalonaticus]HAU5637448.1 winged helix family transcriptional regulator [Citrobacter amalonaticus]HDQ2812898.1 winged helix-turn-helix domain-containing protein [Citrobacter amalonaticus]